MYSIYFSCSHTFSAFGVTICLRNDFKLQSIVSGWWIPRFRAMQAHGQDNTKALEDLKVMLLNDSAAWGVFAALMMTVGFAGLLLAPSSFDPRNEYNDWVKFIFIALMMSGTCFSLLTVIIGTQTYLFFNGIPLTHLERALQTTQLPSPAVFANLAAIALIAAYTCGVYLMYGAHVFYVMLGICCLFICAAQC